jgi:hypothetical protein
MMRGVLLLVIAICFVVTSSGVGITLKYYSDSSCKASSEVAGRSFDEDTCYDLHWDTRDLSTTACSVSVACFLEEYQNEVSLCPNNWSQTINKVVTEGQAFERTVNNNGGCAETRTETEITSFGVCQPSEFYDNCYYSFQLGYIDGTTVYSPLAASSSTQLYPLLALVLVALVLC